MNFGVWLPNCRHLATPDIIRGAAVRAERLGYDSVWVGDHVVVPLANIVNFGETVFDPLVTLAVVAGATRRVRLGTTVLIVPYRNAVVTAKMIASLDALSGGRVVLGIGAGWGAAARDAPGAHAAQRPACAAAWPERASVHAWRARARGRAGRPGRADRRAGRLRRRAPGPRVPRRRRPRARRADGRLRRARAARARVSPSPTLLRCPSPGPYAAPRGVEPMGTFFVEALLAAPERPARRQPVALLVGSGSTYTWVAAALLRALSVVPTERRRVVTIEGQVAERDAAEVLITLEGFGLAVDPVQRKLIPALQFGAANGH